MPLPETTTRVSPFDIILSQTENEDRTNLEALADGSGINEKAIGTDKLEDNSVTAVKLSSDSITLGSSTNNSVHTLVSGSAATTICTVTCTIPDTSREIEIEGYIPRINSGGTATGLIYIYDGSTLIQATPDKWVDSTYSFAMYIKIIIKSHSPGSKTYTLRAASTGGANLSIAGSSTSISSLSVKLV